MYVSLLLSYFMNVLSFFGASVQFPLSYVVILIWQIGPVVEIGEFVSPDSTCPSKVASHICG